MADERHRKRSMLCSKIFWLFVYVVVYVALRYKGDIASQQIALPAPNGAVEVFRMIGPHPDIPQWRQQTWRALFSLAMVAEEEGEKVLGRRNGNTPRNSQNSGMGGPGIVDKAGELWNDAVHYVKEFTNGER